LFIKNIIKLVLSVFEKIIAFLGRIMEISRAIAKYIYDSKISLEQVALDTKIDICKLDINSTHVLSSQEMLEVCSYLRVRPEELVERYHDYI